MKWYTNPLNITLATIICVLAIMIAAFFTCDNKSQPIPARERPGHIVCSDPSGRIMADEDTIGAESYSGGHLWRWARRDGTIVEVGGNCTLVQHIKYSGNVEAGR